VQWSPGHTTQLIKYTRRIPNTLFLSSCTSFGDMSIFPSTLSIFLRVGITVPTNSILYASSLTRSCLFKGKNPIAFQDSPICGSTWVFLRGSDRLICSDLRSHISPQQTTATLQTAKGYEPAQDGPWHAYNGWSAGGAQGSPVALLGDSKGYG
jgi:hypothetical protein